MTAASHEVGHNLGLGHDGRVNPTEEYYRGTRDGTATSWAPIMGKQRRRTLTSASSLPALLSLDLFLYQEPF